jgi:3-oxoacyl-[acyl-carrier-protein] synthase II
MTRVVITGAGAVSPIGNNAAEVMEGIKTGRRGIGRISSFNAHHFQYNFGAEVKDNGGPLVTEPHVNRQEIFIKQAVAELLETCGNFAGYAPANRGLNLGVSLDYFDIKGYVSSGLSKGNWRQWSSCNHRIVEELAVTTKAGGGFTVNVTACVASTQAIGLSFRMLKGLPAGNMIVTGGFDSVLNQLHYMSFYKLGALSNWEGEPGQACRPFDKNRGGVVLGEGAAVFLLQNAEDVQPDKVLAEIVGYSSSQDAYKATDPHPDGIFLAKAAVNAIAEANAMRRIFPNRWTEIPVFSMKGQTGHLIAACGALEMMGVIYSLETQQVPATVNFEEPDPEAPLRVIKENPLDMDIDYVLKLNSAFGGQNAALVVKKYVP